VLDWGVLSEISGEGVLVSVLLWPRWRSTFVGYSARPSALRLGTGECIDRGARNPHAWGDCRNSRFEGKNRNCVVRSLRVRGIDMGEIGCER
jgi:hypothetical protein